MSFMRENSRRGAYRMGWASSSRLQIKPGSPSDVLFAYVRLHPVKWSSQPGHCTPRPEVHPYSRWGGRVRRTAQRNAWGRWYVVRRTRRCCTYSKVESAAGCPFMVNVTRPSSRQAKASAGCRFPIMCAAVAPTAPPLRSALTAGWKASAGDRIEFTAARTATVRNPDVRTSFFILVL